VSEALEIVVSALAAEQIRTAAEWWRLNRPKAPDAFEKIWNAPPADRDPA
jgi:hypothetical protein